jgi:hypothetical protein
MTAEARDTPVSRIEDYRARYRSLPLDYVRMAMRRNEVVRLCRWRRCHEVANNEIGFAKIAADAIAFMPKGQGALDYWTFEALAKDCGIAVDENVAMAAICRVAALVKAKGKHYRPLGGLAAGRLLDVTAEERWQCDIRTMKAVDETPEEAAARRKEERREYERARSRRRRRDAGATARRDSISRAKPWDAQGISRATWYRRPNNRPESAKTRPAPVETLRETISTAHNTRADLGMRPVVAVSSSAVRLARLRHNRSFASVIEEPSRQVGRPIGFVDGASKTSSSASGIVRTKRLSERGPATRQKPIPSRKQVMAPIGPNHQRRASRPPSARCASGATQSRPHVFDPPPLNVIKRTHKPGTTKFAGRFTVNLQSVRTPPPDNEILTRTEMTTTIIWRQTPSGISHALSLRQHNKGDLEK